MLFDADDSNIDLINVADSSLGWTALLRYAAMGNSNSEIPELLIKFKSNVNLLDKEGKSALIIAVINGNQPLAELLINNGADITIRNEFGKNIYDMAVSMDRRVSLIFYF